MFDKLIENIKSKVISVPFDPSSLDDSVAMQTDWAPARGGGANFKTRKLIIVNSDRLEFRPSMGAILFCLVFLFSGMGLVCFFFFSFLSEGISNIFVLFGGIIFAGVGGVMLYFATQPIVFDKREGCFWKGRKGPDEFVDRKFLCVVKLDKIHALQLISERVRGNKSSFYSYELNIVLGDGKRINVVDHGNRSWLREDAATLSKFLRKPVWDATGNCAPFISARNAFAKEHGSSSIDEAEIKLGDPATGLAALVYALQAGFFLVGISFIAAIIVNYLNRDKVAGTWLESHFDWQIRTFWWSLLWGVIGLALLIVVVGIFILIADILWVYYRIAKGWRNLNAGKRMYDR